MSKTIMLIHGAWLNGRCWEGFMARYEARGYTVIAPAWPLDDRSPTELRASPDPALAQVGIRELINHYDRLIRALPEAPILIGHSFGGTVTQHLLDRGLGAAGVAIDPAPTSGVLVGWQTIKSTFPVFFSWGSWRRVMVMSRRFFSARFAQTVPARQINTMYDRYIVPTPGRIYWDGLVSAAGKIRWDNPNRAPLLLIGGGIDLIAGAKLTKAIFEKQKQAPSTTELKIFPNRSHWTCLQPGWEEVADFALDWAAKNTRAHKVLSLQPV
ncbi:alpha/beta hydrolase [Mesorhizobium abyssinicae]|uniref:alpha/beta hydrolase n=1 Tax=Mesorhizobium abyssinicae TaxID=1209958 RepID=UPI00339739B8